MEMQQKLHSDVLATTTRGRDASTAYLKYSVLHHHRVISAYTCLVVTNDAELES
jgi:hypothetical protein